jgi:hypothetical protein
MPLKLLKVIELPFNLETQLEQTIAADPDWLAGLEWGQPRPGHPEGKVIFHIQEVLLNVDRFFDNSNNRARLRLIALLHDTFKHVQVKPGAFKKSHGYWARQFAERYINDEGILEVIELHDEAYKASLLFTKFGDSQVAERQVQKLLIRLGRHLDLFRQFYLCDQQTGDKSRSHYEWFERVIKKQDILPP